jgi:hypothetical protein
MPLVERSSLKEQIEAAGYFPELVWDSIQVALGDEDIVSAMVHSETTFDAGSVGRHMTVLVLTPSRILVGHIDDHSEPNGNGTMAAATTESVALRHLRSVSVTRLVTDPVNYDPANPARTITMNLTWGANSRIDLDPRECTTPGCETDHGYAGIMIPEDLSVTVDAENCGPQAIKQLLEFAGRVTEATRSV